jgi:phosphoglycolate phosphatase-like HAD superfamily hydrolase
LLDGALVTTNAEYSADQAFPGERESDETLLDVDDQVLRAFAHTIAALDHSLRTDVGVRWLGREVVLVGIFGAIGALAEGGAGGKVEALRDFEGKIPQFIATLNLEEFERWRNNLELSKVNIGNVNKREVFSATLEFLKGRNDGLIQWGEIGEGAANDAP